MQENGVRFREETTVFQFQQRNLAVRVPGQIFRRPRRSIKRGNRDVPKGLADLRQKQARLVAIAAIFLPASFLSNQFLCANMSALLMDLFVSATHLREIRQLRTNSQSICCASRADGT